MSTTTSARPRHLTRNIILTTVTAALLAGIFFGGSALWQKRFGLSQASAADCDRSQALIDQAQSIPKGTAAQDAAYKAYRPNGRRSTTATSRPRCPSTSSAYELAAGRPLEQSPESFRNMVEAANGHCDRTVVMPAHPPVATP